MLSCICFSCLPEAKAAGYENYETMREVLITLQEFRPYKTNSVVSSGEFFSCNSFCTHFLCM